MSAIQKAPSGEMLTKQAMRKNNFIVYQNTYILKLLLNSVTAGIEALVSGEKLLYARDTEVCRL
jgi:hypothetical protein